MSRLAILVSSSFGLAAILRAGVYYAGVDNLALSLVSLMAFVLVAATLELAVRAGRFEALDRELARLPAPASADTLASASPTLRPFLRARIEHVASPLGAPSFAPYVVGLLVMLGLLGTFLGLFETLRGAREALASSTDVDALRSGLARPMQGLTRSFGTSAAGVASSASLGLAIVFARRSEARFVRALQAYAAGPLASLTVPRRTLAALEALVAQGASLPLAAKSLDVLVAQGEALPRAAASLESASANLAHLETAWRDAHEATAATWRDAHHAAAATTSRALTEATKAIGDALETAIVLAGPATRDVVAPLVAEMIASTTGVVDAHVRELRSAQEADSSASRTRDEAHAKTLEEAVARLVDAEIARAAALAGHWRELTAAMGESSRAVHAAASTTIASGHEHLADLVARHEALGARVDTLLTGVGEATAASVRAAEAQGTRLATHAAELGEQLARTARVVGESAELLRAGVGESAELLRAGGGELGAVAEAFGVAVDRHRDASTAWLESLGAIDVAVEQAGERAAAGALSDTLARMHEAFDRQIQIELELFTQLRALRGLPPPASAPDHGRKTDAPA